jgi:hypothetical protein
MYKTFALVAIVGFVAAQDDINNEVIDLADRVPLDEVIERLPSTLENESLAAIEDTLGDFGATFEAFGLDTAALGLDTLATDLSTLNDGSAVTDDGSGTFGNDLAAAIQTMTDAGQDPEKISDLMNGAAKDIERCGADCPPEKIEAILNERLEEIEKLAGGELVVETIENMRPTAEIETELLEAATAELEKVKEKFGGIRPERPGKITTFDGSETLVNSDGSFTTTKPDGSTIDVSATGDITMTAEDGSTSVTNADGSKEITNADGRAFEKAADGSFEFTDAAGNKIKKDSTGALQIEGDVTFLAMEDVDGSATMVKSNGDMVEYATDGTRKVTAADGTVTEEKRGALTVPTDITEVDESFFEDMTLSLSTYMGSIEDEKLAATEDLFKASDLAFDEKSAAKAEKKMQKATDQIANEVTKLEKEIEVDQTAFEAGELSADQLEREVTKATDKFNKRVEKQENKLIKQEAKAVKNDERETAKAERRTGDDALNEDVSAAIEETGYTTENYKTETYGDWQIPVYRVTGDSTTVDETKKPVLILPEEGLSVKKTMTGAKWILDLIDDGYDVWMGEAAGAEGSKSKVSGFDKEAKYATNFASSGTTDLPSQIDKIMTMTGAENVNVITYGSSVGTLLYGAKEKGDEYFNSVINQVIAADPCVMKKMTTDGSQRTKEEICAEYKVYFEDLQIYTQDGESTSTKEEKDQTKVCDEFGLASDECAAWTENTSGQVNLASKFYQEQLWTEGSFVEPVDYDTYCTTTETGEAIDLSAIAVPIHFWFNDQDTDCDNTENDFSADIVSGGSSSDANTGHEFWQFAGGDVFLTKMETLLETGDVTDIADYTTDKYTTEENDFWTDVYDGTTDWADAVVTLEGAATELPALD